MNADGQTMEDIFKRTRQALTKIYIPK